MGVVLQSLTALRRIGIVILIAITFLFGLGTTVYLSLRSPEVKVPDVVGKDREEAERILGKADLNVRIRAWRPSNQVAVNTVLFQLPHAGDVVKTGQTVAMDISRSTKEGEASDAIIGDKKPEENKPATNANANESTAAKNENENRPKRIKSTNKNASANENANANTPGRNANTIRNANTNGARVNSNSPTLNANRPGSNGNTNAGRNANQNESRRPPAPKPSPSRPNNNNR